MKLIEVFDSEASLTWQHHGRYELSKFDCEGHEYIIQIEKKNIHVAGLIGKTAEISFFRNVDDSEKAHSSTGDIKIPFIIYGVVANGLFDKFHEYEAFYFIANHRHSKDNLQFEAKKNIYFFLADRLAKKTGAKLYEKESNGDQEYLVTKLVVDKKYGFINEAQQALEWFRKF